MIKGLTSVVIPSRGRPERLAKAIRSVQETAPGVEIVSVLHSADYESLNAAHGSHELVILDKHEEMHTAELWNEGARVCEGEYIVTGADDLVFQPGWLEASLRGMRALGGSGLVALNVNDVNNGNLATHYMVSRKYAVRRLGGVIMPPPYEHNFTDMEATYRARADKALYWALDARVTHEHPVFGTARLDKVYEKGAEGMLRDEELFKGRLAAGFPSDYAPVLAFEHSWLDDWGKVAIGVRSHRYAEPDFIDSWNRMLLTGLRPGDRVLAWVHRRPIHVAANLVASNFLTQTDCDSVLFLDDDMVFGGQELETLRTSTANSKYDIVQGFCTFKTAPPHAVVYKLTEEQPTGAEALLGETYNALAHIPDNDVIEVDAVGMAFTLIKRHVFESMLGEYGPEYTVWFDCGLHSELEDIRFSRRCREAGFKMCVDTNAKIGHAGTYIFGWEEHQQFIRQMENNNNG